MVNDEKKNVVTEENFEASMKVVSQEFDKVHGKFAEVDERFDKVENRLDRIERVMETTLEVVQSIDRKMTEDRALRIPERVDELENDVLKLKARLA